jgi:uncharacterized protein YndB with AHSA1/START domain
METAMRALSFCLFGSAVLAGIGLLKLAPALGEFEMQVKLSKTDVKAPPERIFALIDDFHNWGAWSPHDKADPAVQRTYSGPVTGKGAIYEWNGGDRIGAGRAEIVQSDAPANIVVDLDLTRPVKGRLSLRFAFEQTGTMTRVEAATSGPSDLVNYVKGAFLGGSILRISCAADGSPKALCDVIMKDVADRQ